MPTGVPRQTPSNRWADGQESGYWLHGGWRETTCNQASSAQEQTLAGGEKEQRRSSRAQEGQGSIQVPWKQPLTMQKTDVRDQQDPEERHESGPSLLEHSSEPHRHHPNNKHTQAKFQKKNILTLCLCGHTLSFAFSLWPQT